MRIDALADAHSVARAGAAFTAAEARAAIAARGRFIVAISGGHTPWTMLRALADEQMPWAGVHVVQVDERVAPAGDPDRNLTHLRESLLAHCPLRPEQVHAMPVESADLEAASGRYALTLRQIAGSPAVLDLAHLGLGPDGHTASLVPGDPVLEVTDADVALTGLYQGRRRMTLTYPMLNRSRRILWLVTGGEKRRCWRACVGAIGRFRPGGSVSTRPSCWPTTRLPHGRDLSTWGVRKWPPKPPNTRKRPGAAVALLDHPIRSQTRSHHYADATARRNQHARRNRH